MKKRYTVILADDEENIRTYLESELSYAGFKVLTAENGAQAFQLCLEEDADLLISDISMPDIGGFALMKKLRLVGKAKFPIIFMTAYESHIFDEFTDFVRVEVLSKPFHPEHLVERIHILLSEEKDLVS